MSLGPIISGRTAGTRKYGRPTADAKPGIRLKFVSPIDHRTRAAIRRFCAAIPLVTRIDHRIPLIITPSWTVRCTDGGVGFAAFMLSGGKLPEVWLAGMPLPAFNTRRHQVHLLECLAHELAHYEQWRDGRRIQERGVGVRTRTLARLIARQMAAGEASEARGEGA